MPSLAEVSRPCRPNVPGACPLGHVCDIRNGVHAFGAGAPNANMTGRCTAILSDRRTLLGRIEPWVGRYVAFRAELEPESYACTLMLCGSGNACCNYCQGFARPKGTGFSRIDGVDCLGNECETPSCGVIDARGFNVLDGVEVELRGRVVAEYGYFRLTDVVVGVDRGASAVFLVPKRVPLE